MCGGDTQHFYRKPAEEFWALGDRVRSQLGQDVSDSMRRVESEIHIQRVGMVPDGDLLGDGEMSENWFRIPRPVCIERFGPRWVWSLWTGRFGPRWTRSLSFTLGLLWGVIGPGAFPEPIVPLQLHSYKVLLLSPLVRMMTKQCDPFLLPGFGKRVVRGQSGQ